MRSMFRSALVALAAMCALGAVAAASASAALPEFTGSYPNAIEFKSAGKFETASHGNVQCLKAGSDAGELTAAKTADLTLDLKSCFSKFPKLEDASCQTAGAAENEVKSTLLEGKLYYTDGQREVGLVLKPKSGSLVATIECASGTEKETVKVKGSLIVPITRPVNYPSTQFSIPGLKGTKGVQEPDEYETEGKKVKAALEAEGSGVETYGAEPLAAVRDEQTLTAAKATELKASLVSAGLPEFTHSDQEFKGTTGTTYFDAEGDVWDYSSGSISGKINSPNEVNGVVIKLHGSGESGACGNSETESDTMVTTELGGHLGYLSKSSKTVGLVLEPKSGQPVVPTCKGRGVIATQEIRGSVIVELTPVNTSTRKVTFWLKTVGGDEQAWTHFEGEEVIHKLEINIDSGEWKKLGIETTIQWEVPEALEVKA